jgi:hypothetical protein
MDYNTLSHPQRSRARVSPRDDSALLIELLAGTQKEARSGL